MDITIDYNKKLQTGEDFYYNKINDNPDLFYKMYGVKYNKDGSGLPRYSINIKISAGEPFFNDKIIHYFFSNESDNCWQNYIEHTYIMDIIKRYNGLSSIRFGYINGTDAPIISKGLSSSTNFSGYEMWFKIY